MWGEPLTKMMMIYAVQQVNGLAWCGVAKP